MKQLTTVILLFSLILFACKKDASTIVRIEGRKIMVNNSPYLIKGICYHPVPKGSSERSFASIDQDLALMVEAGINTIRVYAPIDDSIVLDKINAAGIKLIVGFGYNQGGVFDIASGSLLEYVEKYKTHPAILLWELGNEYNYHPEWFNGDINNWYADLEKSAKMIHALDANHPVSSAHGEIPTEDVLANNPSIDVWGVNVYRWDQPGTLIPEWESRSTKPLYFSEAGADSYMKIEKDGYHAGENQLAQADATKSILDQIFTPKDIVSGLTLFSFTDGWWKAGKPDQQDVGGWAPNSSGVPYDGAPNEEYWGIVNIDRTKKEAFSIVKEKYKSLNQKQ